MTTSLAIIDAMANVDEDGYLLCPDEWNDDVALILAQDIVPGDLTEEHWKVIYYLRQYYVEFGIVPPVRKLCRATGFNLNQIYYLFYSGLARGACKIAGIPRITFLYPIARLYP